MFAVRASFLHLMTMKWAPQLSTPLIGKCGRLSSYELAHVNGDMASVLFLPVTFCLFIRVLLLGPHATGVL